MHGDSANRIIYPHPLKNIRARLQNNTCGKGDDKGQTREIDIQARGHRNNTGQRARHHPERIFGVNPSTNNPAGNAH